MKVVEQIAARLDDSTFSMVGSENFDKTDEDLNEMLYSHACVHPDLMNVMYFI